MLALLCAMVLLLGGAAAVTNRQLYAQHFREKPVAQRNASLEAALGPGMPLRPTPGGPYNTTSGPVKGKLNIHIVPHTHVCDAERAWLRLCRISDADKIL